MEKFVGSNRFKKIINFDLHNKILLNNLKNLGVPLQKDKLMR